jgi:hypothetical protein
MVYDQPPTIKLMQTANARQGDFNGKPPPFFNAVNSRFSAFLNSVDTTSLLLHYIVVYKSPKNKYYA